MTRIARLGLCCSFAAIAAVTAACTGTATNAPSSTGPARRIVVLGDSLAVSPSFTTNFPAELQKRLAVEHPGWTVTNQGVIGDTTSGGVRRFDAAVRADTNILLLELGANDGLEGTSIATVETNLSTMIERAQGRGIRVLLCGMETPPTHGFEYSLEFHRLFPRVAAKYNVPLVPFLLEGVALNPDLNGPDQIHPNAAGAARIAQTVWPYLEPLVQAESALVR